MITKYTALPLILFAAFLFLTTSACITEHKCYREHLKVYTNQYIAVCEDGWWTEHYLEDCETAEGYILSDKEKTILSTLSSSCPVVQCIKEDCKCTEALTRTDIAEMKVEDLLDEIIITGIDD